MSNALPWLISLVASAPCGMVKATCSVGFSFLMMIRNLTSPCVVSRGRAGFSDLPSASDVTHSVSSSQFLCGKRIFLSDSFTQTSDQLPSPVELTTPNMFPSP